MLKLIEQTVSRDLYQFENENHDDVRKSPYVYVEWNNDKPCANHPTTMVAYMVEKQLAQIGRQKIGDHLE